METQTPQDKTGENLVSLLKDELSGEERTRLEELLLDSAEWRTELEATRQALSAVASVPEVTPSADFDQTLAERIQKTIAARKQLREASRATAREKSKLSRPSLPRSLLRGLFVTQRFPIAASVAAGVLFVLMSQHIVVQKGLPILLNIGDPRAQRQEHSTDLRSERLDSIVDNKVIQVSLESNFAPVTSLLPDGDVYAIGYKGVHLSEQCVSLLTSEQHDAFEERVRNERRDVKSRGGSPSRAAQWRKLSYGPRFIISQVENGRARVPADIARRRLGEAARVFLVPLSDRVEVWTLEDWNTYAATFTFDIEIEQDVPAKK